MKADHTTPRKQSYKPHLMLSALALALAPVPQAMAQLMLEEVVVTAQKREQGLQDVPIAIAAMSGERIDDIGITSLQELTLYMPNVTINSGAGTPNAFIRGIGSGTNRGFEQSVGMYVDGVYAGRGPLAAVPATMDLARVEVLKGPQGILFGKNTIAGAINITTAKPSDEFEGMVEALYAPDHGEQQYNLVLSGPIARNLAGRIAVRYDAMDGWWENVTLGNEGPDLDNWFARGSLRWDAGDNVEVHAKYEYGDFDRGTGPFVVYQSDFVGQENFAGTVPIPVVSERDKGASDVAHGRTTETNVFALTVNWDIDFATFTSISAYSGYDETNIANTDAVAVPSISQTQWEDYQQYSQELRLVSPGGETIDWIVGGYYQTSELDISRRNDALDFALSGPLGVAALIQTEAPIPSVFDQESESWAMFSQGTWNTTDTVRVSAGIRYNEETKDLDKITQSDRLGARVGSNIFFANASSQLISDLRQHSFTDLRREEEKWTFSGNVQWDATDTAMLYASVSTGFKGGGYDEAYSSEGEFLRLGNLLTGEPSGEVVPGTDASVLEYEDETVLAYELGAKMALLDGAAELNVALFRMEYENLQVSSLVGDVFVVGNAGKAVSQGIELDGRWILTEELTIGGSVAYLDGTYDEFKGATCTVPQANDPANNPGCLRLDGSNITAPGEDGGQDLSGETLLFAPEWSANLNAQYVVPLGSELELRTSVDMNYMGEFYSALDLDPSTKHDSATMWNARIALESIDGVWSVALLGKNLTDEETHVWKNDVPVTNSNSYFAVPERPRSFAIQARYRF